MDRLDKRLFRVFGLTRTGKNGASSGHRLGRYLAIASERTGKGALRLLPIKDGKSAGAPIFVKYGDFEEGVTTAAGGLVYKPHHTSSVANRSTLYRNFGVNP